MNRGRLNKLLFTMVLFGGGLLIGSMVIVNADFGGNQPGTASDPLVTQSYVDQSIEAAVKKEVENIRDSVGSGASSELVVVQLRPGFAIHGRVGTEFIVRNGKAIVFSNSVNGIPDVTSGKDILDGEVIENNHHLINAGEGRGIRPHKDITGTIYVMVRGEFTLRQE